jgi:hypothetical protein
MKMFLFKNLAGADRDKPSVCKFKQQFQEDLNRSKPLERYT